MSGSSKGLDDLEVVAEICERISSGESIRSICKDDRMPAQSTIYARMASDEIFRSSITRAREAQQDFEADEIVEMADNATAEDWQVVKLRIWARQWRASKLAPKKYGDKLAVDATISTHEDWLKRQAENKS